MASRRRAVLEAWERDQAADLRELPHSTRLVRPGSFGTNAERTRQAGPGAPTLDDGALYTGEWREEVDGNALVAHPDTPVILASLRRPWPFVGFAVDTSQGNAGVTVTVGLLVLTRSGHVRLVGNVIGGAPPPPPQMALVGIQAPYPWVGMTGIFVGARVAVFAINGGGDHPVDVTLKANLWGYNAPGYGP